MRGVCSMRVVAREVTHHQPHTDDTSALGRDGGLGHVAQGELVRPLRSVLVVIVVVVEVVVVFGVGGGG